MVGGEWARCGNGDQAIMSITRWKIRPIGSEHDNRLMAVPGRMEQKSAVDPSIQRIGWYANSDGSGGITIDNVKDVEAAMALGLEQALGLR